MENNWISFVLMGVAFVVTTLMYPYVLAFARKHKIVDNPSARKLQRVPVPVMGGTAIFIGLLITVGIGFAISSDWGFVKVLGLLFCMFIIGVWDDIKDIPASFRFLVEMLVVWAMILMLGVELNDFHGFLGIEKVPDTVSIPLSLVAGVGIMNAVNLIDGVDGYCSTYGMVSCSAFAIAFYCAGDMTMFTMALIAVGAILPFFFHNVFGKTSKMFMGDGGSLMLGTLLSLFVFNTLSSNSPCTDFNESGLSLVALCLAILAVPVFDTLRVMSFRMLNGVSPFHPDKTHLHHLFIEMNFSHLATSGVIVFGNVMIIGILLFCWKLGMSIDLQVWIVILCSLAFTWAFYFFMEEQRRKNEGEGTRFWNIWCKCGKSTNLSATKFWLVIRRVVDSKFLGAGFMKEEKKEKVEVTRPMIDPRVITHMGTPEEKDED